MFCRQCGSQLLDQARFCNRCGAPRPVLEVAPVAAEVPEVPVVQEQLPVEEMPVEQIFTEEAPVEETPVEEVPVEEAPVEEAPVEEVPVEEAPVEETPVEETPVEETPVEETPVEETPVEEAPVEEAPVEETPAAAIPVENPPQKPKKVRKAPRKLPCVGVRVVMQILSFLLCVVLLASLIATVAAADLRSVTSGDGIKKVLDAVLFGKSAETIVPQRQQANTLSTGEFDFDIDDIPMDILAGGDTEENREALVEWLYEELKENAEGDLEFSQEQLADFVEESTVTDYLSEKMAGFAEDVLNGTENTEITSEEIMDLLEENEKALKSELNVELSREDKQELQANLEQKIDQENLSATIRENVNTAVEEALQESVGMDLTEVQDILRQVTSNQTLLAGIGLSVLLVALLLLVNYYNLGAGLTWSASAGVFAGLLLSLPLLILTYATDWVLGLIPELSSVMNVILSFANSMAPLHYGLLIGSAVLLVISIVLRIITKARRESYCEEQPANC